MPRVLRRPLALVLLCLAIVAALAPVVRGDNAVTRLDADVVDGIADHRGAALVDVARAITNLGDGLWLTLILAVVVVGLRLARVLDVRSAIAPLVSLAAGAALAPLVKGVVERPRPPLALHEVVERSSGYPSGHSTQAAAGWLALGLVLTLAVRARDAADGGPRRPWPLLVGAVVVLAVGASRVVLSVHSPTDVLAGWLIGLACAVATVTLLVVRPAAARRGDPGPSADA